MSTIAIFTASAIAAPFREKVFLMSPGEVLSYVQAEPFRPFRIRMSSGGPYDIRHPEMIRVGATSLIVFAFVSDRTEVFDEWESVSLLLIESISHLETSMA